MMVDSVIVEDLCDQCQCEATLFCEECRNSYCSTCSSVRHRAGKRKNHVLLRVSKLTNVTHSVPDDPLVQKGNHKLHITVSILVCLYSIVVYTHAMLLSNSICQLQDTRMHS